MLSVISKLRRKPMGYSMKSITFDRQTEGSSPAFTAGVDVRAVGTIPALISWGLIYTFNPINMPSRSEFPEPIGDWMTSIDAMATGQYAVSLSGMTLTPVSDWVSSEMI